MITGGAGVGQTRLITTYNGGNQIATITPNWVTNPAAGSVYQILPGGRVDVGQWLGTGCAAPTVAGVPEVDVTYVAGAAQADIPTAAQVNAQVVDALNVDTYAEPAQGAPPETASIVQKLSYLYKYWRNKVVTSSSSIEVYNDAGAVAVNSENKRRSATQMPWGIIPPVPDGTINAGDRMHVTGFYNWLDPQLRQEGFRWRNDDGTEIGASWRQNQDVDDSIGKNTNIRLRLVIDARGDPDAAQFQLEYKESSDPASEWRKVPTS
jgi:hypothetical protein